MSNILQAIKRDSSIIIDILRHAHIHRGWSLQGFGLLRLYLTKELRLHIWDSRFAIKDVSLIHTHPWDFESYLVSGTLINYRYKKVEGDTHYCSVIQCGEGACVKSVPELCGLTEITKEVVTDGQTYTQFAEEIHLSLPEDGTITLIERTFKPDTEHALSFWVNGSQWISAEPRPATSTEIEEITSCALNVYRNNHAL